MGVPYAQVLADVSAIFRHELQQAQALTIGTVPSPLTEELLSIREAATLLGVTVQTVHEWKRRGLLKYSKLGGRSYLKRADVLSALTGQQRTQKPGKGAGRG